MNMRYTYLVVLMLLSALIACSVESTLTIDDIQDLIGEETVTVTVYTYSSGSRMAYQIYDEEIEVASDGTTSIGPIADGLIYVTALDCYYNVEVDDDTLTISTGTYDPLIYLSE